MKKYIKLAENVMFQSLVMETPKKVVMKPQLTPPAPKRRHIRGAHNLDKIQPLKFPEEDLEKIEPLKLPEVIVVNSEEEDEAAMEEVKEEVTEDYFPIRWSYCRLSPADIVKEGTVETLVEWWSLFSPDSQPTTPEESVYVKLMRSLIEFRMRQIHFFST